MAQFDVYNWAPCDPQARAWRDGSRVTGRDMLTMTCGTMKCSQQAIRLGQSSVRIAVRLQEKGSAYLNLIAVRSATTLYRWSLRKVCQLSRR